MVITNVVGTKAQEKAKLIDAAKWVYSSNPSIVELWKSQLAKAEKGSTEAENLEAMIEAVK